MVAHPSHFSLFNSRRSTVYSTKGVACSSQPLASAAAIQVLSKGGNAVDAAIAASAVLTVTEPASTGIGGDCFALFHDNATKTVRGLNGCGRAAQNLSIDYVREVEGLVSRIPNRSVLSITVPGAIAGWVDALEAWGLKKVSLKEVLEPAIELAENGFGVHEILADLWRKSEEKLRTQNPQIDVKDHPLLVDGRAPKAGDFFTNKRFAETLRLVAQHGKSAFYEGPIADAIIATTTERGHKLTPEDLKNHTSTFVDPISVDILGHRVHEIPPNGQGLVVLIALGILRELHNSGKVDLFSLKHNSKEYLHLLIEVLKIAFHDGDNYVADPAFDHVPVEEVLGKQRLAQRAALFDPNKTLDLDTIDRVPDAKNRSDTVYLTVADPKGNVCSFINSVYYGFGSGIVVEDYGFALTNRGANFNLTPGANNALQGGKRPYHTIIPALVTDTSGEFRISYGNMGGFIQPVGHVMHFLNLVVFQLTPQQSIDLPRFALVSAPDAPDHGIGGGGPVSSTATIVKVEDGIDPEVVEELKKLGHTTTWVRGYARAAFGRAQIIKSELKNGKLLYAAGSDLRGDGMAVPYV